MKKQYVTPDLCVLLLQSEAIMAASEEMDIKVSFSELFGPLL